MTLLVPDQASWVRLSVHGVADHLRSSRHWRRALPGQSSPGFTDLGREASTDRSRDAG